MDVVVIAAATAVVHANPAPSDLCGFPVLYNEVARLLVSVPLFLPTGM